MFFTMYKDSDIVSAMGYLVGPTIFYTRSSEVMKQIVGSKTDFHKNEEMNMIVA
jgi:Mn2+/Fe2+ NRAMP family transporter